MTRPPLTPQPPETPPSVHAPGQTPTRRYPDDPQPRTEATRSPYGLLRHRTTTLHGGPLNGQTARIYPNPARRGEPHTITLTPGTNWPHWEPTHWHDYHRHNDGTYHWTKPSDNRPLSHQDTRHVNQRES